MVFISIVSVLSGHALDFQLGQGHWRQSAPHNQVIHTDHRTKMTPLSTLLNQLQIWFVGLCQKGTFGVFSRARFLHPIAPMSLFHTVYEGPNSTYFSYGTLRSVPSLETVDASCCKLSPATLLASLAQLAHLCYDGLDAGPQAALTLNVLRNAVLELLVFCVQVDRLLYSSYVQALASKHSVFMEKVVLQVLRGCFGRPLAETCHLVKAVHDVVLLTFSFTGPLKLPPVLDEVPGSLVVKCSTTTLLQTIRNLYRQLSVSRDTASPKESANETASALVAAEIKTVMSLLTSITLVAINNCVPTQRLFAYFADMDHISVLDLEYFEEYVAHFVRVAAFCQGKELAYFDAETTAVRPRFYQLVCRFPQLAWCTPLQATNHTQVFVDAYNEIYGQDLILERLYHNATGTEATVVRRVGDIAHLQSQRQTYRESVPGGASSIGGREFIQENFKEGTPDGFRGGVWRSGRRNQQRIRLKETPPEFVNYFDPMSDDEENLPRQAPEKSASYKPEHPFYLEVFQINEDVAYEVRNIRADLEELHAMDKVSFREPRCLKCKYVPWHKHK